MSTPTSFEVGNVALGCSVGLDLPVSTPVPATVVGGVSCEREDELDHGSDSTVDAERDDAQHETNQAASGGVTSLVTGDNCQDRSYNRQETTHINLHEGIRMRPLYYYNILARF